jgi:hypothetical protein
MNATLATCQPIEDEECTSVATLVVSVSGPGEYLAALMCPTHADEVPHDAPRRVFIRPLTVEEALV